MSDLDGIQKRKDEVKAEIARLESEIATYNDELAELETAEAVLLRLQGKPASPFRRYWSARRINHMDATVRKLPSLPKMILAVMKEKPYGLSPKQIENLIYQRFGHIEQKQSVASVVWRMADRGQDGVIKNPDAPEYFLAHEYRNKPPKEEQ